MNSILKFGFISAFTRLGRPARSLAKSTLNHVILQPVYSRTLWNMCSTSKTGDSFLKPKPMNECCHCGCSGLMHTGGEKELIEFLNEEIDQEIKAQKMRSLPAELDGFVISAEMAELILEKKMPHETITVSMNVNHSVDAADVEEDVAEEMKSSPSFEVDIVRNKKTLSFSCSFTHFPRLNDADTGDLFEINEVTYFEGEWSDKTYSVAADILDENLYDLFMLILNEKGITKKFMQSVSEIATSHEHSQYISLLKNVRKFASAN